MVVVKNTCPQNGHNVGSQVPVWLGSPFEEVYCQWSLLCKDLQNTPPYRELSSGVLRGWLQGYEEFRLWLK